MNWWYHKEEWDQVSVKENELKFEFSEAEDPLGIHSETSYGQRSSIMINCSYLVCERMCVQA